MTRRRTTATVRLASSALIASLLACGTDSPTTPLQPAEISLTAPNALHAIGDTLAIQVTARDKKGNSLPVPSLTWSSTAEAVASVDQEGKVVTQGSGETTIRASSNGGLRGEVLVSVADDRRVAITLGGSVQAAAQSIEGYITPSEELTVGQRARVSNAGADQPIYAITAANDPLLAATIQSGGSVTLDGASTALFLIRAVLAPPAGGTPADFEAQIRSSPAFQALRATIDGLAVKGKSYVDDPRIPPMLAAVFEGVSKPTTTTNGIAAPANAGSVSIPPLPLVIIDQAGGAPQVQNNGYIPYAVRLARITQTGAVIPLDVRYVDGRETLFAAPVYADFPTLNGYFSVSAGQDATSRAMRARAAAEDLLLVFATTVAAGIGLQGSEGLALAGQLGTQLLTVSLYQAIAGGSPNAVLGAIGTVLQSSAPLVVNYVVQRYAGPRLSLLAVQIAVRNANVLAQSVTIGLAIGSVLVPRLPFYIEWLFQGNAEAPALRFCRHEAAIGECFISLSFVSPMVGVRREAPASSADTTTYVFNECPFTLVASGPLPSAQLTSILGPLTVLATGQVLNSGLNIPALQPAGPVISGQTKSTVAGGIGLPKSAAPNGTSWLANFIATFQPQDGLGPTTASLTLLCQ